LVERNKLHIGSIPQKESSIEGNVQPVTDAPRSSEFSDHSAIKQAIPHDQKSTEIISQIKQNQKDSSSQISDSLCALDPPPSLLRTQLGKILILLIVLVVGIGGWFVYSTFQTLSPNVPIAPLVREPRMITGISDDIAVRRSAAIARHKPSEAAIAKEIELSGKTPERPEQAIKERTSNMPVQEHQAVIEKESKRVVRSEGKSKPARRIEKKAHITQAKRSVRGCPADIAGFHWVRLNVQPVGVNFTGKILTGKVNRLNNAPTLSVMRDYAGKIWTDSGNISNSICVSIQRGIQIQLTNNQYKTCIIEIPARAGTLQIKMEKEDRYGINIRPANYCLQNK
jgi:hypothetical protein